MLRPAFNRLSTVGNASTPPEPALDGLAATMFSCISVLSNAPACTASMKAKRSFRGCRSSPKRQILGGKSARCLISSADAGAAWMPGGSLLYSRPRERASVDVVSLWCSHCQRRLKLAVTFWVGPGDRTDSFRADVSLPSGDRKSPGSSRRERVAPFSWLQCVDEVPIDEYWRSGWLRFWP